MKINFKNTEDLTRVINKTYFGEDKWGVWNKGVLIPHPEDLKIPSEDIYYNILSGLDYDVKVRNPIIDGSLTCQIVAEDEENIVLRPISRYCIKSEEIYSFY